MDRVHSGGPWTWGPCFVYVPVILCIDNNDNQMTFVGHIVYLLGAFC